MNRISALVLGVFFLFVRCVVRRELQTAIYM
eukprot:SAG22_NODE_17600_length_302_cov_0.733990_1_plen_31_part_10